MSIGIRLSEYSITESLNSNDKPLVQLVAKRVIFCPIRGDPMALRLDPDFENGKIVGNLLTLLDYKDRPSIKTHHAPTYESSVFKIGISQHLVKSSLTKDGSTKATLIQCEVTDTIM